MVPVVDRARRSVLMPKSIQNKFGYELEFDEYGSLDDLQIDKSRDLFLRPDDRVKASGIIQTAAPGSGPPFPHGPMHTPVLLPCRASRAVLTWK